NQRRRPAPLCDRETEIGRADQLAPVLKSCTHVENRARINGGDRVDHTAVAVFASVAMIPAQAGNRIRVANLNEIAPGPAGVNPSPQTEVMVDAGHHIFEVEIGDVASPEEIVLPVGRARGCRVRQRVKARDLRSYRVNAIRWNPITGESGPHPSCALEAPGE